MNRFLTALATLGPVGFAPKAPGTAGTLVALVFVAALRLPPGAHLLVTAVICVLGVIASSRAEAVLGRKDPGCIIVDEFAGYLVATALLPGTWGYLIAAFVLFRFFDIVKPPPINKLQDIKGGMGIMVDDIAAGLAANLILQAWKALS